MADPRIPAAPRLPFSAMFPLDTPSTEPHGIRERQPNFFAKLFGGGDPTRSGLLELIGGDANDLGRQGLLSAGLSMLERSGSPSTLGEIIASGVRGGQEGYQRGFEGRMATTQQAQQQAMMQNRQAVMQKYRGKSDLQSMQAMLSELIAIGDIDAAKPLAGYLANAVNVQAGGRMQRPMELKVVGPDGKPQVKLIDPVTLKELASYPAADTRSAIDALTRYQEEMLQREDRRFRATQEDKVLDDYRRDTQDAYQVLAKIKGTMANVPLARAGDGAAKIDLLYTFITALDPNSAVREGEIQLARMAASLRARASQLIQQVETGGDVASLVPPALVDQIATVLKRRATLFRDRIADTRERAVRRAKSYDMDTELFKPVPEIEEELDLTRYKNK
jgi:hypothetical protein